MVMVMPNNAIKHAHKPQSLLAQWIEDVHCVFGRDPAAHNVWEILLTYSGVHAVLFHRVSHRLWRANWRLTARLLELTHNKMITFVVSLSNHIHASTGSARTVF